MTRWNSTYDMLEFACDYREAIDSITGNQKMKLRQYELSEEDWEIATKLHDILKVGYFFLNNLFLITYKLSLFSQIFKDATLFFSRGTPSIATVIPAMDHINEHLTTAALEADYPTAIKAALAVGKTTLNKYYNKTDHSEIFRIAMVRYYNINDYLTTN